MYRVLIIHQALQHTMSLDLAIILQTRYFNYPPFTNKETEVTELN